MARREIRRTGKPGVGRKARGEAGATDSNETEVKLRVPDRQALLRQLARLRATYFGRVHEMNTLYDTSDGALRREGKLLRIRVERPAEWERERLRGLPRARSVRPNAQGALLTFKGPVRRERSGKPRGGRRYKIREEREVRVPDAGALVRILEALWLRPSFRYEKYRSTYRLPGQAGVTLELDETPIGDFLEAEGNRRAIDRAAELLGYGSGDYITKSYGQLFLDQIRKTGRSRTSRRGRIAGAGPRDMLFRRSK